MMKNRRTLITEVRMAHSCMQGRYEARVQGFPRNMYLYIKIIFFMKIILMIPMLREMIHTLFQI